MPDFFDYEFYDRYTDADYQCICKTAKSLNNIHNVSMLRHYINCWGITTTLLKYLGGISKDNLAEVTDICFGNTKIEDIINDWRQAVEDARDSRRAQREAEAKNEQLIEIMAEKRNTMCGIGTRLVKVRLNKRVKDGDKVANLYRMALEIEDLNVRAKKRANTKYEEYAYTKKATAIKELLSTCADYIKEGIDITYGKQEVDNPRTNYVVYFEFPNMEQISFHTNLTAQEATSIPDYDKEWDGKVNSTVYKLEAAINKSYDFNCPPTTPPKPKSRVR